MYIFFFFFSSRRRHTRFSRDWSSDVCSSDLRQSVRERSLDDVPRHLTPSSAARRRALCVVLTDAYSVERHVAQRLRQGDASATHDPSRLGAPDPAWRTSRPSLLLPSATLIAFDGRRGASRAHRPYYPGCPAALPILAGEPEPDRLRGRLAARANAELAEDRRDVVVDRPLRENEPLGDLGVAQPFGDESEHL